MTNSLARIFDGIIEALEARVIPKIADEPTRGQAYGALDMLRNLKPRVEWAVGPLRDDVAAELALVERIAALAGSAAPPRPTIALGDSPTAADLEAARDRLDEALCGILRSLADHRDRLPAATVAEIEGAIREQQRVRLKREVKLTAPPLFGEISRGR
jgi:hypothetical protein